MEKYNVNSVSMEKKEKIPPTQKKVTKKESYI